MTLFRNDKYIKCLIIDAIKALMDIRRLREVQEE